MNVAVPLEKHSWILGQLASSHTVTSSRALSLVFSLPTALPDGSRTLIHEGLRRRGASASKLALLRAILSAPSSLAPLTLMGIRSVFFSLSLKNPGPARLHLFHFTITQLKSQVFDQLLFCLFE